MGGQLCDLLTLGEPLGDIVEDIIQKHGEEGRYEVIKDRSRNVGRIEEL